MEKGDDDLGTETWVIVQPGHSVEVAVQEDRILNPTEIREALVGHPDFDVHPRVVRSNDGELFVDVYSLTGGSFFLPLRKGKPVGWYETCVRGSKYYVDVDATSAEEPTLRDSESLDLLRAKFRDDPVISVVTPLDKAAPLILVISWRDEHKILLYHTSDLVLITSPI